MLGVDRRRRPTSPPSPSRRPGRRSGRSRAGPSAVAHAAPIRSTPQPVSDGLPEKPKPGSEGATTWKASAGVTAERDRVDERLDHLVELDDRAGPAVGDHQRHRVGVRRALVDEVDVDPVDLGDELVEAVERRLARAPVVLVDPVLGDRPARRRAGSPCDQSSTSSRSGHRCVRGGDGDRRAPTRRCRSRTGARHHSCLNRRCLGSAACQRPIGSTIRLCSIVANRARAPGRTRSQPSAADRRSWGPGKTDRGGGSWLAGLDPRVRRHSTRDRGQHGPITADLRRTR